MVEVARARAARRDRERKENEEIGDMMESLKSDEIAW